MSGAPVIAPSFAVVGVAVTWLGPDPLQGDRERWRLRVSFAAQQGPDTLATPLPRPAPGAFRLVPTDGGAPAAVVAVQSPPQDPRGLDLIAVKLCEPRVNSEGRQFRLAVDAPGLLAEGAAARFALGPASPARPPQPAAPASTSAASISYLARDYPALVEALQSALRLLDPQWQDVSPADVGVTLTEVLAYGADNLSYYQDAVATEAYLATARRRLSVRRHARQLGYVLREGCNARAWVQVQVLRPLALPAGTGFLALPGLPNVLTVGGPEHDAALRAGAVAFETLQNGRLDPSLNRLEIYDWEQPDFSLPQGAQAAVFRDAWLGPPAAQGPQARRLDALAPGAILILEDAGGPGPPDPLKRWPVRVQRVDRLALPSASAPDGLPVVSVTWSDADALPFAMAVSRTDAGRKLTGLSFASGNVVAVDQGQTVHAPLAAPKDFTPYRPVLPAPALIYAAPADLAATAAASGFLHQDPNAALAAVTLQEQRRLFAPRETQRAATPMPPPQPGEPKAAAGVHVWQVRADLLASGPFARDFVVEADNDDTRLRFGDGTFGRQPDAGSQFTAVFRVGDMAAGQVAREAIATLAAPGGRGVAGWQDAVVTVRNPLAAAGAAPPDPLNLARRMAAIGVRPQSLAALADYEAGCRAFRDVDQAAARLETTGSWPLISVFVRRRYGRPADAAFCGALAASLADRLIGGRRLAIRPAIAIGLAIEMEIAIARDAFVDDTLHALQAAFSPRDGFFCLDNWPLGSTLYASQLVSQALQTRGVVQAQVVQLDRLDRAPQAGGSPTMAVFGPHEYPLVDSDAADQYGRIVFRIAYA